MDAHVSEWLQLFARWLHVLAGAAWVGTSFYFTWLNHSIRPPAEPSPGVSGELWSVHGGGFYTVRKYGVAPERMPAELHWFKWEAYTTWLSGASLLVLVYYLGSGAYLLPPETVVSRGAAVAIGAGTLVGGWIVYDALCRSPLGRRRLALALVLVAFAAAVLWGLGWVLSPRAALIHTGAMLGTWMAANVFFVIIPGQRAMVRAMAEGRAPDPERGRQGAMRSLHNNYLTMPVIFAMVGIHYPVAYASRWAWAVLAAVFVLGIAARLYYNLRHAGRHLPWLLPAAAAGVLALIVATAPRESPRSAAARAGAREAVAFPVVSAILDERCLPCHAAAPTWPAVTAPPLGVVLETEAHATAMADRIGRVVETGTMPLANLTGMTPEERAVVLRWVREGARGGGAASGAAASPR